MKTRIIHLIIGSMFPLALVGHASAAGAESKALVDTSVDATSAGGKLYQDRCATCHDHSVGRAPTRITFLTLTPEIVARVLTDGAMRAQASGLNAEEIRILAKFVTGKQFGASPEPDPQANACKQPPTALRPGEQDWNGWGKDADNSRFQQRPNLIAADVPRLKVKWVFAYPGHATYAPPVLVGGNLFLGSMTGRLFRLDAKTGCTYWSFSADAVLKGAPTVAPWGKRGEQAVYFVDERANAYAVDAADGKLLWRTTVDDHSLAQVTGSALVSAGRMYIPVASKEELASRDTGYACCTFRGNLVALDAATGKIIWKSYTIDQVPTPRTAADGHPLFGPAGGAIWHSATLDARHSQLFVVTGNSYIEPTVATTESVLALDLATGRRKWTRQLQANDNWTAGCWIPKNSNCPVNDGNDNDIATAPVLRTLRSGRRLLLTAQKTGTMYALDPDAQGKLVWQMAPGGNDVPVAQADNANSGIKYGLAVDTDKVYAARTGEGGVTAFALDTGKQIWRTPAPDVGCTWGTVGCTHGQDSAVSLIPGALFAGSHDGHIRAYATDTGAIIWDFDTAAAPYQAVNGAATGGTVAGSSQIIGGGMLYVNSGYLYPQAGNALIAFSVDGR